MLGVDWRDHPERRAPATQNMDSLGEQIVGAFYDVYNDLGHGYLEHTYVRAVQIALRHRSIESSREVPTTVYFRGEAVGEYRMDLVVAGQIVVECKRADRITPAHQAQLLHYLKSTRYDVGLLLNFGPRPEYKRMIFDTARRRGGGAPGEIG